MNSKVVCFLMLAVMAHIALGEDSEDSGEGGEGGKSGEKGKDCPIKRYFKGTCEKYMEDFGKHVRKHGKKFKQCDDDENEDEKYKECIKRKLKDYPFPTPKEECREDIDFVFNLCGSKES